jgi:hypothetical protein
MFDGMARPAYEAITHILRLTCLAAVVDGAPMCRVQVTSAFPCVCLYFYAASGPDIKARPPRNQGEHRLNYSPAPFGLSVLTGSAARRA